MPPNPLPVAHSGPTGRDTEIAAIARVLRATTGPSTLLVTGGPGSGKTTVLEAARSAAVGDGVRVLRLPVPAAYEGWSTDGPPNPGDRVEEGAAVAAGPLADAVCGLLAKIRDTRVSARVNAVRRARSRLAEDRPAPHADPQASPAALAVLAALGEALTTAAHRSPLALIGDGMERLPPATVAALALLLRVFRPAGLPVVLAAGPPHAPDHPPTHREDGGTPLLAAVDRVLDLPPLHPRAVAALVERRLGRPVERELVEAVTHDLGTLAGNPRALLALLADLADSAALPEVDGRLGPPQARGAVTFPLPVTTHADDLIRLSLTRLSRQGHAQPGPTATEAAATLAHLTHRAELFLPDLHRLTATGTDAGTSHTGTPAHAMDDLFRSGVLTLDRDRGERIAFAVPALATALLTLPNPGHPSRTVPALHAAVVRPLADRLGPAAAGTGHPRLADHVTAAGQALEDATAIPLLLAAARKDTRADQPRALRAYTSALRRLHPDDPRTPDVLRRAAALGLARAAHAEVMELEQPLRAALETAADTARHDRHSAEATASLHFTAQAWTLSALHEHTLPADPPGHRALTAELLAAASRYGIGPQAPPAPCPTATPARTSEAPLPLPAELRLLSAATGNRTLWNRARRALPPEALDGAAELRLRAAASYGDLTGGLRAVLGDRYLATGNSAAARHHAMVLAYHAGDWDAALSAARRIEARTRATHPLSTAGHPAVRALAAEIHCFRGDLTRARSWLELIPDTIAHPLAARVRLTVRSWSGRPDEALEGAWRDVARAREEAGLAAGTERLLLRILRFTLDDGPRHGPDGRPRHGPDGRPDGGIGGGLDADRPEARRVVRELAALYDETGSPLAYEALLLARGVVHRDTESARAAHTSASGRGDLPLALECSRVLADLDTDPKPWLADIARATARLGIAGPARTPLSGTAHRNGMPGPRRPAGPGLSEQDVQLITMVGEGATNRQIAARLACSEKTVEQRLTRLFQRTGRRSRVELTTAWLDGALTPRDEGEEERT
ncbi:AAA family ATPase [Streptomyces sp. NPDC060002]|uniref:helix-turn-helix transcriptional regulator n=1 Tax=Streptomyces sp. NPDC060002 TaxID=3347033 RepID=UPI0036B17A33